MRITGLATGLDMDEIIKNSMKPYRIKIDQTTQSKDVVEIKQKLYRDIMSEASSFYDKYFDVLKDDNLLSSKNYSSVKFTSSSGAVSVKGSSNAEICNYTIEGTSATAARAVVTLDKFADVKEGSIEYKEIIINGQNYKVEVNKDKTKMAEDLNNQLKKANVNVKVRYSDMAGTDFINTSAFVFESTVLGAESQFTIGKQSSENTLGISTLGKNATPAEITGIKLSDIENGNILIGDSIIKLELSQDDNKESILSKFNEKLEELNINFIAESDNSGNVKLTSNIAGSDIKDLNVKIIKETAEFTKGTEYTKAKIGGINLNDIKNGNVLIGDSIIKLELSQDDNEESILSKFNEKLKELNIKFTATSDDLVNVTLTSDITGSDIEDLNVKIAAGTNFTSGEDATKSTVKTNLSDLKNSVDGLNSFTIDGNALNINLNSINNDTDAVTYLNKVFESNNINITVSVDDGGGILFKSKDTGNDSKFELKVLKGVVKPEPGTDSSIRIKDDKGGVYTVSNEEFTKGVILDGVEFKFNGQIPTEGVSVIGEIDVSGIKDKLVNFINDYNTLIEKLNTLTSTKHDRSYTPLTADQKKEMSEEEIKLWNERVEKGQLYKDSDLTRISNSMKETMRTFMEDSGLNLEKIGITPVKDYSGTKNGTFTIDESKLTKALEEDIEGVMNLFVRSSPEKPTDKELEQMTDDQIKEYEKAKNQTGILYKLKDTIYSEFKTSTSLLSKKVGMSGTASFTNNELTKSIADYESKIKKMETDFSRREQTLYSKYATLETMMNKLNSQQSNLLSQLGMS